MIYVVAITQKSISSSFHVCFYTDQLFLLLPPR